MSYEFKSVYFDDPIISGRIVDFFDPEDIYRDTALFFVHGGGWTGGSRQGFHNMMRKFNSEGIVFASTDYRMGPGVNIFDQITDIRHGYDLFVSHLKELNRPLKVMVHGSSAGAHLAALLSFAKPGECGETVTFQEFKPENEWISPAGVCLQATPVTMEPWDEIFPQIWVSMQKIAGASYEEKPELYRNVSPQTYFAADSCPVFFMEAENEHMFPLRLIKQAVEKLNSLGVRAQYKIYANAEHGFFYELTRKCQKDAYRDFMDFLDSL